MEFQEPWYAITNPTLGVGVGLSWSGEVFPHAWYWTDFKGSSGYPFYSNAQVMAIEPNSSIPGQGLVKAMEKTATHLVLEAGQSMSSRITAQFFENTSGVQSIGENGAIEFS